MVQNRPDKKGCFAVKLIQQVLADLTAEPFTQNVFAYTDSDTRLEFDGIDFEPHPEMELQIPKMTGVLKEGNARITLQPKGDEFLEELLFGEDIIPVKCVIYRVWERDNVQVSRVVALGEVYHTINNFQGQAGRGAIEIRGWKQLSDKMLLGLSMTPECQWTFRGNGCNVTQYSTLSPAITDKGQLSANYNEGVNGYDPENWGLNVWRWQTALIPGVVRSDLMPNGFMVGSNIRRRIVDVVTVDFNLGIYDIILPSEPPQKWIDVAETIGAMPVLWYGCKKSYEACQAWSNESRFMGAGIQLPAYNPILEEPA